MSGFAFSFHSEDIDNDGMIEEDKDSLKRSHAGEEQQDFRKIKVHSLHEMLSTLPSTISYSVYTISVDPPLRLPRRELFDIRAQLSAEADVSDATSTALVDGLGSDDIKPRLYEGGFKTWECSIDLARFLMGENLTGSDEGRNVPGWTNVVEIGAGTALPSCTVLKILLNQHSPGRSLSYTNDRLRTLTVADYNIEVLTHAAIPNLLLTFAHTWSQNRNGNSFADHGELEITEELLDSFQNWLKLTGLTIYGVSGPWSTEFSRTLDGILDHQEKLILASETIYQPSSLPLFTEVLLNILQRSSPQAPECRALVAAKKVYFGVGGGVDEFLSCLELSGGHASVKWNSGNAGIGRVVLDVQPREI